MEAVTKKYIMSANGKSILSQQERIYKGGEDSSSHRTGAQMMCQGHGYDQPVCGGEANG